MKKAKQIILACSLLLPAACGTTTQTTTTPAVNETAAIDTLTSEGIRQLPDVPGAEVLTVKDALLILDGQLNSKEVMKKYGYKYKKSYEVSMLDKYDNLYYKNCTLPRMLREGVYADLPRPQKKGISSYAAINKTIEIGVFNAKAYGALVDQVKACGFKFDMGGYEDKYTHGNYRIACYASGKRIRIEKL